MKKLVVLLLLIALLSILSVKCFTIDLIHRDSPLSPFYNASMTQTELLINAAMRSNARMKSFHLATINESKVESTIAPSGGDYLMYISIGTPPVKSVAMPDTGSDLIWFQCLPCEQCYTQPFPTFDPDKSNTHKPIPCDYDSCNLLSIKSCGPSNQCKYEHYYGGGSYTKGDLATDTIGFNSNEGKLVTFPNTIMGCGHDNKVSFTSNGEGVVGLGAGPLSLVSQLGDKIGHTFSYCLLPHYATTLVSKLKFGSESSISGDKVITTPFVPKYPPTFYYLSLEGVSIDGKVVKPYQNVGNIIIDSGTTFTYLKTSFYNSVEAAVKEAIGADATPVQDPVAPFKLCYGIGTIKPYPNITLQFFDADALQLLTRHIFGRLRNMECFMILPTEEASILGNSQQVNFQVEYDLQEKTVSFASRDCRYV